MQARAGGARADADTDRSSCTDAAAPSSRAATLVHRLRTALRRRVHCAAQRGSASIPAQEEQQALRSAGGFCVDPGARRAAANLARRWSRSSRSNSHSASRSLTGARIRTRTQSGSPLRTDRSCPATRAEPTRSWRGAVLVSCRAGASAPGTAAPASGRPLAAAAAPARHPPSGAAL